MIDVAHCDERKLYKEFGVNAEFLIDHSWGKESCTIKDIKQYKPKSTSISNSQILFKDYNFEDAKLVLVEMVELLSLQLIEKNIQAGAISLYIGYSKDIIPSSGANKRLANSTNLYSTLTEEFKILYDKTTNKNIPIRRIGISFGRLSDARIEQLNLFENQEQKEKERKLENAINIVKLTMGKNAIIRGMDLQENATTLIRNKLVGGHNGG